MAERTLAYFMRETAKNQDIVEVPGIDSIRDEKGNVVPFKIKMLTKKIGRASCRERVWSRV